jgi:thiamine kinase-like enzyme
VDAIREALVVRDEGTVPCNNDLLAENFVDDGQKIWLIDYEYSGNNDACFELGNVWAECRLDLDQLEELVTSYYGRPRRSRLARARLQGVVGQYGWTLWGAIQHAVSPMDFDFWEWAMERYEIAVRELTGADFARLLEEAQLSD